ncbi:hypothetical protein K2P56_03670 [Patescibacteria group bacterium]|nr:hypothetical protein [Patescibacteria group bacterium]
MADEHNGNLIVDLLAAEDSREVVRVLNEMDEIKDPSFTGAIMKTYYRFTDSTIPHYFISSLKKYSSPQVKKFLTDVASDPKSPEAAFIWSLDYLADINFLDDRVISRIKEILSSDDDFLPFDISQMAKFLKFAGALQGVDAQFLTIVKKQKLQKDTRETAIRALLELDPTKYLQWFIDNFQSLVDSKSDNVIAEVLTTWNGSLVTKLEEMILEDGNDRAKELVTAKHDRIKKDLKKESEKKAESTATTFSNADVIDEIYRLKRTINLHTLSDSGFGFQLLPDSDLLASQMRNANSEAELIKSAIDLRATSMLFHESIENHGIDFETAKQHIPNTNEEEMKAPLNKFYLFLISRSKDVPDDLFGLRRLNLVPNKSAHPDDQEGMVKALTKLDLLEFYKNGDWLKIQRALLELYRDSLRGIDLLFR